MNEESIKRAREIIAADKLASEANPKTDDGLIAYMEFNVKARTGWPEALDAAEAWRKGAELAHDILVMREVELVKLRAIAEAAENFIYNRHPDIVTIDEIKSALKSWREGK